MDETVVSKIESIRKELLADKRKIMVNDLGAGSVRSKHSEKYRKVCDIARYSSIPEKYGRLLSNLAREFGNPRIIELGTSVGISSMYMSGSCNAEIETIEGCSETAAIAERTIRNSGFEKIKVHRGSFDEILPKLIDAEFTPGLVFIDGNHRKDAVLNYFDKIAKNSGFSTVVVLDDIYLSREMKEAWNMIRKHDKVTVSIDINKMGIVFFRKGINSNHFVVRH